MLWFFFVFRALARIFFGFIFRDEPSKAGNSRSGLGSAVRPIFCVWSLQRWAFLSMGLGTFLGDVLREFHSGMFFGNVLRW